MPKWSRDYLLTALLGGLALVLSLAVAVEWTVLARHRRQNLQAPPAKTAPLPEPEVGEEDFELPALDDYEQMAERPLFMENRRPGSEVAETAAPPPPPTPMNLKLMGIVLAPEGKTALLVDGKGKYKRLKAQDALDGWVLVELGADRVTMQQGDKREDLPLLKKRPKIAPPPQPGAPPPGQPPRPGQRPPPPPPPPVPQPGVEAGEEVQEIPEEVPDSDVPDEDTDIDTVDEER